MISAESTLDVADNSGARKCCASRCSAAQAQDCSVGMSSLYRSRGDPRGKVKKATCIRRIVRSPIRCGGPTLGDPVRPQRGVLINKQMEPIGTRIFGPVVRNCGRGSS